MKRILFPTDFSVTANRAFLYALHFADSFNAELIILHVYDLPIIESSPLPATTNEIFDIVEMNQFESFREELPALHQVAEQNNMGHVPIKSVLLYGDLVYTINKVCKDELIDLIVMGTKGATGLKETFIGSATASVMANSVVPVLGIPSDAAYSSIDRIGFATQYLDKDKDALLQTLEIGSKFNSKIYCLYIQDDDDSTNVAERMEEWENQYKNESVEFLTLTGEDKEHTLLDFIAEKNIDLIVMCKHRRGFFEGLFHQSLTKKMAYHTKVPILVFHDR